MAKGTVEPSTLLTMWYWKPVRSLAGVVGVVVGTVVVMVLVAARAEAKKTD
jgi:hypothetical protein